MNVDNFTTMRKILHYNASLHVVVFFVFVLASSGFTTILHECRLQQQMACCAIPDRMNEDECNQNSAPKAGASFESDQACHTNSIIGGLAVKQAIVEKDKISKVQRAATLVVSLFSDISFSSLSSSRSDSRTEASFLSPVGKHILNSSFLI